MQPDSCTEIPIKCHQIPRNTWLLNYCYNNTKYKIKKYTTIYKIILLINAHKLLPLTIDPTQLLLTTTTLLLKYN